MKKFITSLVVIAALSISGAAFAGQNAGSVIASGGANQYADTTATGKTQGTLIQTQELNQTAIIGSLGYCGNIIPTAISEANQSSALTEKITSKTGKVDAATESSTQYGIAGNTTMVGADSGSNVKSTGNAIGTASSSANEFLVAFNHGH